MFWIITVAALAEDVEEVAASAPVNASQPQLSAAQDDRGYEVGPDDQLRIKVWGESDLSAEYMVDDMGMIQFPLLGAVDVEGKTIEEVTDQFILLLSGDYLHDPRVTVSVTERGSKRVDVLGAVAKPGAYYIRGGTKLLDVLSSAGGIDGNGVTEVRIQRKSGPVLTIAAEELLMSGVGDVVLESGDRIIVPKGPIVYAAGQVAETGAYDFREGMTATQLVSAAGGPTATANLRAAYILRDGERIPLNLRKIIKGRSADIAVKPGDQLFIQESVF